MDTQTDADRMTDVLLKVVELAEAEGTAKDDIIEALENVLMALEHERRN